MSSATGSGFDPPPDRAWAVINTSALANNVRNLRERAPDAAMMVVVKADGYGHGLLAAAEAARTGGAEWLGVALLGEALQLRAAGDTGRILAWLPVPQDPIAECVRQQIDLSIGDPWMLDAIVSAVRTVGVAARVHLKVDTGLGRGGVAPESWDRLLQQAARAQAEGVLAVEGVWSHLAYADCPGHPTIGSQIEAFEQAVASAHRAGVRPQWRHIANSAATLANPAAHYDLVRPGIAAYGLSPGPDLGEPQDWDLQPVMTVQARLVQSKQLPAGHGISYGHRHHLSGDRCVAVVPLGYADGIPRHASGAGPVTVAGRRQSVAGTVCMDQFVVDLGAASAAPGDVVTLWGDPAIGGPGTPSVQDWADAAGTIGYELVTRLGPRVRRIEFHQLPAAP